MWIMGETADSGHNLGFDGRAKRREIQDDSRTILGRDSGHGPDPRIGLILGDSLDLKQS